MDGKQSGRLSQESRLFLWQIFILTPKCCEYFPLVAGADVVAVEPVMKTLSANAKIAV
jgi:hypothetical protein